MDTLIMKSNRKNKKLTFIRIKNKLRTGEITYICSFKVSEGKEIHEGDIIKATKKLLFDQFKLSLNLKNITWGYINDDFIRNIVTYKIELSLK